MRPPRRRRVTAVSPPCDRRVTSLQECLDVDAFVGVLREAVGIDGYVPYVKRIGSSQAWPPRHRRARPQHVTAT